MDGFIRRAVVDPVRDFICPPVCLTCDALIDENVSRICNDCWNRLIPVEYRGKRWREIRRRFTRGRPLEDLVACYYLDPESKLQDMIQHMKYKGKKSLCVELGRRLGEILRQAPSFSSAQFLVPVPLHPVKKRERGYNQSEFICRGVSEITRIPVEPGLLLRTRYTETQTQLSMEDRKTNVLGAFALCPGRPWRALGRRIVIIDDVITTGATITACASVLASAGAEAVLAAAVALAV